MVGIPILPGESIRNKEAYSDFARRCRNFALSLAAAVEPRPVFLVDEAHTSKEAASLVLGREVGPGSSYDKRVASARHCTRACVHTCSRLTVEGSRQAPRVDAVSATLILDRYFGEPQAAFRIRAPVDSWPVARQQQGGKQGFSEAEIEAHMAAMLADEFVLGPWDRTRGTKGP